MIVLMRKFNCNPNIRESRYFSASTRVRNPDTRANITDNFASIKTVKRDRSLYVAPITTALYGGNSLTKERK